MNVRTVDKETHRPLKGKEGIHWASVWNQKMKSEKKEDRMTVVFVTPFSPPFSYIKACSNT